jgi:glycosyltransferase involved in cell wall biosynthesis
MRISVVVPCLNEEPTIGICIDKIRRFFDEHAYQGEIIVVDNSSEDGSVHVARNKGVLVLHETVKGYGAVCRRGLQEAKGDIVVIADGDDTYDFLELEKLIEPLKHGSCDLVSGTRLNGTIKPGAMPWLHHRIGNPFLTWLFNVLYGGRMSDLLSGYKAITREAFNRLILRQIGMQFTAELMVAALRAGLRIKETPITYSSRSPLTRPKLRSFQDGWGYFAFLLRARFF